MQRKILALLAATIVTTACVPNAKQLLNPGQHDSADACSELTTATRVQILLPAGSVPLHQNAYVISDPAAVRQLVDFVNLRKSVSAPGFDTPVALPVRATFYADGRNVGTFGYGPGLFSLQCGSVRGIRRASAAESSEFQVLIARPTTAQ